jgi:hypothetical protein
MVKFVASTNGKTLIGLGLSRMNLQKLKEGKPILVDLASLNLPYDAEVMIFYGKTEQTMAKDMLPYISEDTIVHGTETL